MLAPPEPLASFSPTAPPDLSCEHKQLASSSNIMSAADEFTLPPAVTMSPDLQVILPSHEPDGDPCTLTLAQLNSEASDLSGAIKDINVKSVPPLTETQRAAVRSAWPKIVEWSKIPVQHTTEVYRNPKTAQVIECDSRLDGVWRFADNAEKIRESASKHTMGRLIFVAGQRDVRGRLTSDGPTDSFPVALRVLTEHLGCPPDTSDEHLAEPLVEKWWNGRVVLVSGADASQSDKKEWLQSDRSAPASERTKGAARRLATILGDDPFVWRGGSNWILFGNLDDDIKSRCSYVEMINPFCANDKGLLVALSHASADLKSFHEVTQYCVEHDKPIGVLHGQFLDLSTGNINEWGQWSRILTADVPYAGVFRAQTTENLGLTVRWTAQIESHIRGIHGQRYKTEVLLPRYRSLLGMSRPGDETSAREGEEMIVDRLPWAADTMQVKHYNEVNTAWASRMRRDAALNNTRNPCNQSSANCNAMMVDGPVPRHKIYLPGTVDFAGISKGSQDSDKVGKLWVTLETPTTYVAICGDEMQYTASVEDMMASFTRQRHTPGGQTDGAPRSRVVDEPLARSIESFIALQESAARDLQTHLTSQVLPADEDAAFAEGLLTACRLGPAISEARSVLRDAYTD